ncbi:MAG TPA: hypothetical protein VKZ96_15055 [Thermomicrobiales bacterium]|nr:hypothetical protein [Thermomicrobiales bacterium]
MSAITITRRGTGPLAVHPAALRLTPQSFGASDVAGAVRGRVRYPRGWSLEAAAPLAWFARPDAQEIALDEPAVFTLELEFGDGRRVAWTRAFDVRLDLQSTFDPQRHAYPARNSARVIGEVGPRRDLFQRTYRLLRGPLAAAVYAGLYSDIVQLRLEGEHRGGLCSGMARWAGLRALRGDGGPPGVGALDEIITLHGRQLNDRALLSSLYWFLRASPTAAYRAVRDDFLRTGKSLRALDIGVPKPWRRDIARAVVRQGHTIVPFRIRQESARLAYIDCYDPNTAHEPQTIELHLDTDRYSYRNKVSLDDARVGMIAVPHAAYAEPGTAFLATIGSLFWILINRLSATAPGK